VLLINNTLNPLLLYQALRFSFQLSPNKRTNRLIVGHFFGEANEDVIIGTKIILEQRLEGITQSQ
jgi:hypothetical protein